MTAAAPASSQPGLGRALQRVHRDQRDGADDRRHGGAGGDRPGQVAEVELVLEERDDQRDEHRRDDAADQHGDVGREPGARRCHGPAAEHQPEQLDGHADLDQQHGRVDAELEQRLAADDREDDERADQPREHQLRRRGEEQAEHERRLGQRDGACAAAHLHVQHADLGDAEQDGQQHPGDRGPGGARRVLREEPGEGDSGGGNEKPSRAGAGRVPGYRRAGSPQELHAVLTPEARVAVTMYRQLPRGPWFPYRPRRRIGSRRHRVSRGGRVGDGAALGVGSGSRSDPGSVGRRDGAGSPQTLPAQRRTGPRRTRPRRTRPRRAGPRRTRPRRTRPGRTRPRRTGPRRTRPGRAVPDPAGPGDPALLVGRHRRRVERHAEDVLLTDQRNAVEGDDVRAACAVERAAAGRGREGLRRVAGASAQRPVHVDEPGALVARTGAADAPGPCA